MKSEATRALLPVFIQLTLVHVVVLNEGVALSQTLFLVTLIIYVVSHVLREKVIIEILLPPLKLDSDALSRVCLNGFFCLNERILR